MRFQITFTILTVALLLLSTACDGKKQTKAPQTGAISDSPQPNEIKPTAVSKPQAANSVPEPVAAPKSFELFPPLGTKATCPVMGGAFSIKETSDHSEYKGRHYFFCCPGCKPSFDENPEKYLR